MVSIRTGYENPGMQQERESLISDISAHAVHKLRFCVLRTHNIQFQLQSDVILILSVENRIFELRQLLLYSRPHSPEQATKNEKFGTHKVGCS